MELKDAKTKAQALSPMLRIGKSGLTDTVIDEIKSQLKKKKLIKIKILRAALDDKTKEELFKEMIDKSGAVLVTKVGFVITLLKGPKK